MPDAQTRRDNRSTKILYIEDNPENRVLARAVLEAEGYTVSTADDGLSGIETAIRERPSLILLDVNLPGVDGYEAVAILKSFPNLANTPVIAVTAYAMEGDRQRTLVAGCDGYIQKPIDVDAFPSQVAEFLRGKRERVEAQEEGVYLRELNQRLVYRLLNQVEELKRLNGHFMRRAGQLEDLHRAVQTVTSELGVTALLEKLLPGVARALGSAGLTVDLAGSGTRVTATSEYGDRSRSVLAESGLATDDWSEVEWRLPLKVRDHELGMLAARHVIPTGARADEEQLLKLVSNQIAIAVENARLYEETQQRLRATETLLAVSQAVGSTLDPTETLRRVAREAGRALGADTVGAYLADADRTHLRPIAGYHVPKDKRDSFLAMPIPLEGHHLLQEALRTGEARYSTDVETDSRVNRETVARFPHRSMLFVPMIIKGEPIGGLFLLWFTRRRQFSPEEIRLIEGISRPAALGIENARLYEGVKRHLQELQQTQAQLIQSAKLAAIGELAANVAHEINNPLTAVLGFASYLSEQVGPGQPMREELDLIQEEAGRARDIVRDLLDFSRQHEFSAEPTDLNVVVRQTLAMVRRQRAVDNITFAEHYATELPLAEVDQSRLKQVFINIVNNALYAMSDVGILSVRTAASDGQVLVEFGDTGSGIAPEHLDRIFDPFFTTKPDVSGTGLGLSVSLGIVQSHGGTIEAKSEVGKGSTFTVKLPALAPGAAPAKGAAASERKPL
jgi:signal transduction histidine kinase/DNA-binding response OmpR family regulator